MKDKLTDLLRIGKVSSINWKNSTAKVVYEDRDHIVSGDLFILVPFTLKDKAYYMPCIGERVVTIYDPNAPSKGYILGSFFAETRQPPIQNPHKTYINFQDGTLVAYDKQMHQLNIQVPKEGETSISIKTKGNITIESEKDLILKGKTSSMVL